MIAAGLAGAMRQLSLNASQPQAVASGKPSSAKSLLGSLQGAATTVPVDDAAVVGVGGGVGAGAGAGAGGGAGAGAGARTTASTGPGLASLQAGSHTSKVTTATATAAATTSSESKGDDGAVAAPSSPKDADPVDVVALTARQEALQWQEARVAAVDLPKCPFKGYDNVAWFCEACNEVEWLKNRRADAPFFKVRRHTHTRVHTHTRAPAAVVCSHHHSHPARVAHAPPPEVRMAMDEPVGWRAAGWRLLLQQCARGAGNCSRCCCAFGCRNETCTQWWWAWGGRPSWYAY